MRVAWFSPLPPAATGIAAYSADVLPLLDTPDLVIDRYDERRAHDFVWKHHQSPYDVVVYQLGNSPWHDYMWGYLFQYPGLVVLHDARLHHARAAQLFRAGRVDEYRDEFAYDHPHASGAAAEYAVQGLRGAAFYFWPMVGAVVDSARMVAVHNEFVAQELRQAHPAARVERIHLGVPARRPSKTARSDIRRRHQIPVDSVVFVVFGLVTAEKRVEPILRAFAALAARSSSGDPHLLFVGANEVAGLDALIEQHGLSSRVHVTGYIEAALIPDYLHAADVSLSLRWPTAEETSGAWAESLAAAKPTIITSLPHTTDVPALDARTWQPRRRSRQPVAISVDLLEEDAALLSAMTRLTQDGHLRERLGRAAHDYWKQEHDVVLMAEDYRRTIVTAAALPDPRPTRLPSHLRRDYSERVTSIADEIGIDLRW